MHEFEAFQTFWADPVLDGVPLLSLALRVFLLLCAMASVFFQTCPLGPLSRRSTGRRRISDQAGLSPGARSMSFTLFQDLYEPSVEVAVGEQAGTSYLGPRRIPTPKPKTNQRLQSRGPPAPPTDNSPRIKNPLDPSPRSPLGPSCPHAMHRRSSNPTRAYGQGSRIRRKSLIRAPAGRPRDDGEGTGHSLQMWLGYLFWE